MEETEVAEYFDSHSECYQCSRTPGEITSWEKVDDWIVDVADGESNILDIGCGHGLFLEYVKRQTPITDTVGIDISRGMLLEDAYGDNERVIGSATHLPFEADSFDIIHVSDVLHHVVGGSRQASKRKARAVLADAVDLLKDGGTLVLKEQYYEGPLARQRVTSSLIFTGLKNANRLAQLVDDEVEDGLLVSFYTRDELVEMIEGTGTTIVDVKRVPRHERSPVRNLLIHESGRIVFLIRN